MGVIICSAKEACKLMEHMNEDDMVILSVINKKHIAMIFPEKLEKRVEKN